MDNSLIEGDPAEIGRVLISQIRIGTEGKLRATLGSCVGIAVVSRDPSISGLAHCLLPVAPEASTEPNARYADRAVSNLLRQMGLTEKHARRAKIYLGGGGNVLHALATPGRKHIGELNLEAARAALKRLGIEPIEISTGSQLACSMTVDCVTREVTCSPIEVAETEQSGQDENSANRKNEEIDPK